MTNWKHSNKTFINKFRTIDSEPNDNHSCWLLKVLQNDNVTIAKKEAMSIKKCSSLNELPFETKIRSSLYLCSYNSWIGMDL